jgi:hypothetical protein
MSQISGYVTFSYKNPNRLSPKNKAKITHIYNTIGEESVGKRFIPIKSTKKKHAADTIFAAEMSQGRRNLLRGTFVPENVIGDKGRLVLKGNKLQVVSKFATETYYPFDPEKLVKNTEKYLRDTIPAFKKGQNAVIVTVNTELQDRALGDKEAALTQLLKLINDYSPNQAGTLLNNGKNLNHAVGTAGWRGEGWLVGIKLQQRKNQK